MLCVVILTFCLATVSATNRWGFCSKPSYMETFVWRMNVTILSYKQTEPYKPSAAALRSWEMSFSKLQNCHLNWTGTLCTIDDINHSMSPYKVPQHDRESESDSGQIVCGINSLELAAKRAVVNFEVSPYKGDPSTWRVYVGPNNIVSVTCYHRIAAPDIVKMVPSECRRPGYPMFIDGDATLGILYGILPKPKGNLNCSIDSKKNHWIFRNCKYCEYRVLKGINEATEEAEVTKIITPSKPYKTSLAMCFISDVTRNFATDGSCKVVPKNSGGGETTWELIQTGIACAVTCIRTDF